MSLTDDEVRRVIAAPKRVTEEIEWKRRPGSTPSFECTFSVRVPAEGESGEAIPGKVEATHNRHETKCAFIYAGVCIRRWESAGCTPESRRPEDRGSAQARLGRVARGGEGYAALMSGLEGDA